MASALKIGFVIYGTKVPAWYAETVKAVVAQGHDVLFVRREKRAKEKKSFALRMFEAFEEKWFRQDFDAAQPVSLERWLNEKNIVTLAEKHSKTTETFDVLYTIHFNIEEAQTLSEAARHGLWYVHFGLLNKEQSLPAFWEVMNDSPVTESALLIYKGGQTVVAYEGSTRTVPYSVKNNFASVAWKASSYLPLRLAALQSNGETFFTRRNSILIQQRKQDHPGNGELSLLALRNTARYLRYKLASLSKSGKFTLLYSFAPFKLNETVTQKFVSIPLRKKNAFYADPFVIEKDGINYVFFEEMDEAKEKAHISLLVINHNKEVSNPKAVLERPYHLSYPFVFLHEGNYYMVPETAANKTVELYKATAFPHQWSFVMNLMQGVELLDATLHFEKGRWWLFASAANHPFVSTNDQLFLFFSNDLFSTAWTQHPQNPVATHAGNCRPAGRIFRYDNKLYRPAQNNASPQYGYGLKLNEITLLTETAYEEKEALSISPGSLGLKACHHLDFSSSLIVVDGIPPPPKGGFASNRIRAVYW